MITGYSVALEFVAVIDDHNLNCIIDQRMESTIVLPSHIHNRGIIAEERNPRYEQCDAN